MELGSRSRRCCAAAAGAKGSEASAIRINAPQPDRRNSRRERTHVFTRPLIRSPRTPTGQEGKPKIVAEERRGKQRGAASAEAAAGRLVKSRDKPSDSKLV